MSAVTAFHPDACLVIGLADDPDGSLVINLGQGVHTHVDDESAKEQIRNAWAGSFMGHLILPIPSAALCNCEVLA